jgi:3-methyladenine DNA glycosylase AlkD
MTHLLVRRVREALRDAADPAKAGPMQRYMKSDMPFRGVSAPAQHRIWRRVFPEHPLATRREWQAVALTLWREAAYREERYAAIALTDLKAYLEYRTRASLPMFEEMIVTGAWWDLVEELASHHIGDVLRSERLAGRGGGMRARLVRWARGRDLWKRRAAILCQIRFRRDTDLHLLYACIDANLDHPRFFIRKAIGWALRSYAWTDPAEVRRYVAARRDRLSPLSIREATKNLTNRRVSN